ncbi:helix-turn-helix domain-containing protein [Enterococcus faecalis]|uniref:helix-turn-helix domain-containing protein n=1 Tax=Enterococcus faecalis TaxID=1351 RepID=UPI001D0A115F|nr:helix-turn-helix domain-containing protein [Enterococcus faecalis]
MTSYKHISVGERELIFLYSRMGYSIRRIARLQKGNVSTISRELQRHTGRNLLYSPSNAQNRYKKNKKKCGRKRLLDNETIKFLKEN